MRSLKSLARDQRGIGWVLVSGMAAIFTMLVIWYMMAPAVEELAGFVENETEENSIAHKAGSAAYTIWTVILVFFILIVIAWMFVATQRRVGGTEYQ